MLNDFPLYVGYAGWLGLALISLIFLANAGGVIDQARAQRELAAAVPSALAGHAGALVGLGRAFQIAAVPALFFPSTRPYAALGLVGFLAFATLTAHAFWRAEPAERGAQIASFLKNVAVMGGLLIAAGWRG